MWKAKTHCKYGHEFLPGTFRVETQVVSGNTYRKCLLCPSNTRQRQAQPVRPVNPTIAGTPGFQNGITRFYLMLESHLVALGVTPNTRHEYELVSHNDCWELRRRGTTVGRFEAAFRSA